MEPKSPQQLWTKELDIHFANVFHLIHGDKVSHSRDSNEATTWHWEEVLKRLMQDKKENWPESLASIEALKKRWKLFRTWYAKAYSAPDVQYENDIDVPRLIRRLQERNYEEEGRRGRRKGSLWKRKKSTGEDSTEGKGGGNDSTIEGVEVFEEETLPSPSIISPIIQSKKKSRIESTTTNATILDPRLESWLSVLRDPVIQKNFRIHTHSDIILEPEALLNIIRDPFASLLQLAQSLAPLEWVSRILDPIDNKAMQEYVMQKKNFFILPSKARTFLLILVHFPSDPKEQPLFWIFQVQGEHEKDHEKHTAALGLPEKLFTSNFQWKFTTIGEAKSLPLYLFSICLSHVITGISASSNLEEQLSTAWPEPEVIHQMLLTKILLNNSSTNLQVAPPNEPLQFRYASLLDAIQAYGVSSPSWFIGFAADKRQEFLQAIRDITNTVVFVIDMNKPKPSGEITWKRKSTDKVVLLIAERNGQFGGIIRLKLSDDMNGATLHLLANRNSINKLQVNGSIVKNEEYVLQFRQVDTMIRCCVNDVQFHLVCTS